MKADQRWPAEIVTFKAKREGAPEFNARDSLLGEKVYNIRPKQRGGMREISEKRLKEVVTYDQKIGKFMWLERPDGGSSSGKIWNKRFAGRPAGSICRSGYQSIRIDGVSYRAHRLAWLYMTGSMPTHDIDHINGNRADNRICNLRDVTRGQNLANTHFGRPAKSGFRGVHKCSKSRWMAQLSHGHKSVYLGIFSTPEDASAAYLAASERLRGFAINGK